MFEVIPLGVGSALPTQTRNLSATLVRREGRSVLFDCGEGTQLQLVRGGLTRGSLDAICITHLHGDHLFGLPGLIMTLAMLERTDPLVIAGPQGIREMMDAIPGIMSDGSIPIRYVELTDGIEHQVVYENAHVTIAARAIEHRVPCWGYRYQEKTRPGSLDGEGARAAGITEGDQFEALKAGRDVTLDDGTVVLSADMLGPERPGAGFAYVLDTMPCDGGRLLAQDADLLMHEATFEGQHTERADEVGHSTARQAAEVARDAGAKKLLLTHFSARYTTPDQLVLEAQRVFSETEAAVELQRYDVKR